jgi:hypothetical protein
MRWPWGCAQHRESVFGLLFASKESVVQVCLRGGLVACCTLCTFALRIVSTKNTRGIYRMHTNLSIGLDIVASCLPAVVLRSETLLPNLQVLTQHVTALLNLVDTHSDLSGVCQGKSNSVEGRIVGFKISQSWIAVRVTARDEIR